MTSEYPTYPGDGSPSGQQPAGQQPTGQPAGPPPPAYNDPTYSAPGAGQPAPGPGPRPGGVTAAAIITIVLSALTAISGLVFAVASSSMSDYLRDNPDLLEGVSEADRPEVLDALDSAFVGVGVFLIVLAVIGIVLGLLVLKPRPWARVLLTVAAALTALSGLIASLSLVGLPWLLGSIAVIVLLFVGRAGDWFAGRSTPQY